MGYHDICLSQIHIWFIQHTTEGNYIGNHYYPVVALKNRAAARGAVPEAIAIPDPGPRLEHVCFLLHVSSVSLTRGPGFGMLIASGKGMYTSRYMVFILQMYAQITWFIWKLSTPLPPPRAPEHSPGDAGQEDLGHTVGQGSPRAAGGPAADRGRGQPLGLVQLCGFQMLVWWRICLCSVGTLNATFRWQRHTRLARYMCTVDSLRA